MALELLVTWSWYISRYNISTVYFSTIAIAVFYAFGQGTGPVFLNNMRCTGAESSLLDCNYTWPDVHQCSHLADGGVVCPPCKYLVQIL